VTVLLVNWNSLPFARVTLEAVRTMSPPDTEVLVVDNGSSDGSVAYLRTLPDVRVMRLPTNVGHGAALDLGVTRVRTEYVAVLDVDAFPISDRWLDEPLAALAAGADVAGAYAYRNFIHPCYLVTRTALLRDLGLTFRPAGHKKGRLRRAPFYMDTGEALSHRVVIHRGGGHRLHRIGISEVVGDRGTAMVFGNLVYHNQGATWGPKMDAAMVEWEAATARFHPDVAASHQSGASSLRSEAPAG
jgi:glycosyltransferase involved in cell wall biosynthesis